MVLAIDTTLKVVEFNSNSSFSFAPEIMRKHGKIPLTTIIECYCSIYFLDDNFNFYNSFTDDDLKFIAQKYKNKNGTTYSDLFHNKKVNTGDQLNKIGDIVLFRHIYTIRHAQIIKTKLINLSNSLTKE